MKNKGIESYILFAVVLIILLVLFLVLFNTQLWNLLNEQVLKGLAK